MNKLIVFTRFPVAGSTKTRLIPALGEEGAARFQKEMTELMLRSARSFCSETDTALEVRYTGASERRMRCWTGPALTYRDQGPGDLGDRLKRAVSDTFSDGADRTVVVGIDCPFITPRILKESFERLNSCDVVLGPASDGGYYLTGLTSRHDGLFENISWGSEKVLAETTAAAEAAGLNCSLMEELPDIDRPEDIGLWETIEGNAPGRLISVIIPALNEGPRITATVKRALYADDIEVIVADGGSTDDTVAKARAAGASVVTSEPGRGIQMNTGAAAATGDSLLFLHADTVLPSRYDDRVRDILSDPRAAAGAFRIEIDGTARGLRTIASTINLRSRLMNMPYGDQALFMRKTTFCDLGGFPAIPVMEDYALVRRLRKLGKIRIADSEVSTSARRWTERGMIKTTLINQLMILGYHLGINPEKLASLYQSKGN